MRTARWVPLGTFATVVSLAMAAGWFLSAAAGFPLGRCRAVELPLPHGYIGADIVGMDPSGQYIVGSGYRAKKYLNDLLLPGCCLWRDGGRRVSTVEESGGTEAVNARGDVLGTDRILRADGTVVRLDVWGAKALNSRGDAVGTVIESGLQVPVIWDADRAGKRRTLEPGWPSDHSGAEAINDDGVVAGYLSHSDPPGLHTVTVWRPDGSWFQLGDPGLTDLLVLRGDMLLDRRPDSVDVYDPHPPDATRIWNLRNRTSTLVPRGVTLQDVNSSGAAAGYLGFDPGGEEKSAITHAALVRDGRIVRLPEAGGDRSSVAMAISDDGVVAGTLNDLDPGGRRRPVVWLGC